MFCWPCITVYQYNETNMMHFWFNLLRIKGLYMFRALLAHHQEPLHKLHLVYCMRIMSDGCDTIAVAEPHEDRQVMLETCRGPWFAINLMKSASRWFHYTDPTFTSSATVLTFRFSTFRSYSKFCFYFPCSLNWFVLWPSTSVFIARYKMIL
jgi:hypothetical protein